MKMEAAPSLSKWRLSERNKCHEHEISLCSPKSRRTTLHWAPIGAWQPFFSSCALFFFILGWQLRIEICLTFSFTTWQGIRGWSDSASNTPTAPMLRRWLAYLQTLLNFEVLKKLRLLFLVILILPKLSYSQGFIHQKRSSIKTNFIKSCEKDSVKFSINETDSLLILSVKDPHVLPLDIICRFDNNGKCFEQVDKLCCDSCSDKLVKSWMDAKTINWHLIDSTHYISGMGNNLLLTIIDSKSFSVRYLRPKEYLEKRRNYKEAKRNRKDWLRQPTLHWAPIGAWQPFFSSCALLIFIMAWQLRIEICLIFSFTTWQGIRGRSDLAPNTPTAPMLRRWLKFYEWSNYNKY